MFTCVLGRYVASTVVIISTQTFRRALTASVDSWAKVKSSPSVALPILADFGGRFRKAKLGVSVINYSLINRGLGNWRL